MVFNEKNESVFTFSKPCLFKSLIFCGCIKLLLPLFFKEKSRESERFFNATKFKFEKKVYSVDPFCLLTFVQRSVFQNIYKTKS